jgi:hypothetical protein
MSDAGLLSIQEDTSRDAFLVKRRVIWFDFVRIRAPAMRSRYWGGEEEYSGLHVKTSGRRYFPRRLLIATAETKSFPI